MILRVAIGVPFRYGRGYGLGREGLYTAKRSHSVVSIKSGAIRLPVKVIASPAAFGPLLIHILEQYQELSP